MNAELKPFDKVLVRVDNSSDWACDLYSHYLENLNMHCCLGGAYSQVIPYEGNEHLLGTNDAPQPKRWRAGKGKLYYFVDGNFDIECEEDLYSQIDDDRYNIGNYFKTLEEAEEMVDRFRAMLKGGSE